jgi:hypothetical protein
MRYWIACNSVLFECYTCSFIIFNGLHIIFGKVVTMGVTGITYCYITTYIGCNSVTKALLGGVCFIYVIRVTLQHISRLYSYS